MIWLPSLLYFVLFVRLGHNFFIFNIGTYGEAYA